MIAWVAFTYKEVEYDLSHLHPVLIEYVQPGKAGLPAKNYAVEVCYSLHCFSKSLEANSDPLLNYSDARETRTFDFDRYELSKLLPQIIHSLNTKKCMHTGKGNFFVVEVITPNGNTEDYEIYFDVQRTGKSGVARLFIQSAYVRDPAHGNRLSTTKKISLFVILHNKLTGKSIKVQR
ncbi:MAG: hypothetical protein Q8O24_05835 [Gallionellaceae bacterium]|nr:hypothetical protein [Gallionellaceae bacterium]